MSALYVYTWVFFIYAFLGWCTEVCYAALVTGKFVNRGFLNGPLCPIYGFGVLLVGVCLTPLRENTLLLFAASVALTSLLELATGCLLEKVFHERWWDYSDEPFNFKGYICLRFSLAWGLAVLLVVEVIHPGVVAVIRWVPRPVGGVLLTALCAALAVDLVATVKSIAKLNHLLQQIDELAGVLRGASDGIGGQLADRVLDLTERGEAIRDDLNERREDARENLAALREGLDDLGGELKESLTQRAEDLDELRGRLNDLVGSGTRGMRRLLRAFPKLRPEHYRDALDYWRRHMDDMK